MACSPTFSSGCSVWNRNNSTENVDCPCAYHQWVKRASSDLLAGFRALPPLLVCPVPVLWKFLVPSLSLLVRMEPSPSFHPISLGTPSLSCLCSQWPLSSRYPPPSKSHSFYRPSQYALGSSWLGLARFVQCTSFLSLFSAVAGGSLLNVLGEMYFG